MTPSEFYELDIDDYAHVQAGYNKRKFDIEGLHRRVAYVIASTVAATQGVKGFDNWFKNAWPYGDEKFHESIADRLKRKRKESSEIMVGLTDRLRTHELLTSRKKNNARRISNKDRG